MTRFIGFGSKRILEIVAGAILLGSLAMAYILGKGDNHIMNYFIILAYFAAGFFIAQYCDRKYPFNNHWKGAKFCCYIVVMSVWPLIAICAVMDYFDRK
ncbi:hypothetical protein [Hafnia phage yong3]|nr:hypothetical protein [Hafnia phage yong3]